MSLRGPAAQHLHNEARRAEFTDGMRWDGMGWMEYQKCPSNFFIICGYIEHVYTYLYIYSKIVTNILIAFKISCQVGRRQTDNSLHYTHY